jgi:hypothetical protein
MTQIRTMNQIEVRYCALPPGSTDTWQHVKKGTCTSAGAADGTTLIDTNGDSGGADTYNGRYWVRILSGTCKNEWCRVVDDDGSGTLTFEDNGFSAQIASAVEYEIWQSPDPVVVVDSSSGETNMVDAVRAEANVGDAHWWVGYYALPITGTYRGKKGLITDFDPATGTFTLATGLGGALAAGDVVLLRKFVEAGKPTMPDGPAYHPRSSMRANMAIAAGVVGARPAGQVTFEAPLTPSGSLAASGSPATASVLNGLLQAAGLIETVGTSVTVGAGSSSSAVKIATGTREKLNPGQLVVWNGNATFVSSLEDGGAGVDTVNVTPSLPGTPAAADVLYASRSYAKTVDGDTGSAIIEIEIDEVRHTFTGCKGSVDIVDGGPVMANFKFNVDHWVEEYKGAPWTAGSCYTSATPVMSHEKKAYLSTTAVDIGGLTASPNNEVSPRSVSGNYGVNGRAGYQTTDSSKATATFRELSAVDGELDVVHRFMTQTEKDVIVAWGSHGNTAGLRIPVAGIKAYPKLTGQDNLVAYPEVMEARDAATALNGTTVVKVPDWALCLT